VRWLEALLFLAAAWVALPCRAAGPAEPAPVALGAPLTLQIRQLILDKLAPAGATAAAGAPRVDITLGQLDPRLRLTPCQKVDTYLPQGSRLWGPARVGLRCIDGPRRWNVYLPVTVTHFGQGVVSVTALPAGHVLVASDLRETEVKLTEHPSPVLPAAAALVGRSLAQPLGAGQALRQASLKPRQWFAPGDTVQVRAVGGGYAVQGSGEALTAGLEGQPARVRTEGGKMLSGMPVGERQLEIAL
jgi:flagella basal body P-ring formation protein FlgA